MIAGIGTDLITVERMARICVDHCCALMFPAETIAELEEQIEWFAQTVGLAR